MVTMILEKPAVEPKQKKLSEHAEVAEMIKNIEESIDGKIDNQKKAEYIKKLYNRVLEENVIRNKLNDNEEYKLENTSDYWLNDKESFDKEYDRKRQLMIEDKWQAVVNNEYKNSFWGKSKVQYIPFIGSLVKTGVSAYYERKLLQNSGGWKNRESIIFTSEVAKNIFNEQVREDVVKREVGQVELLDMVKMGKVSLDELGGHIAKYRTKLYDLVIENLGDDIDSAKKERIARLIGLCGVDHMVGLVDVKKGEAFHKVSRVFDNARYLKLKFDEFFNNGQSAWYGAAGMAALVGWRYVARNNDVVRGIMGGIMGYKLSSMALSKTLCKQQESELKKIKLKSVLDKIDNFDNANDIWKGLSEEEIADRIRAEKLIIRNNNVKKWSRRVVSGLVGVLAGAALGYAGVDHEAGHDIHSMTDQATASHVEASNFIAHAHASSDNNFVGFGGHFDHGLGHDVAVDHVDAVSDVAVVHDVAHETSNHVSNMEAFTDQVMDKGEVNIHGVWEYCHNNHIDMHAGVQKEIMSNLDKYSDPHKLKDLLEHTDKFKIPFMGMGNPDADIHGISIGNSDGMPTIEDGFGEGDSVPVEVASNYPSDNMPTIESGFGEHEVSSVNYQGSSFYDNHNVDYAHDGVPTVESGFGETGNTDHVSYDHVSDNASDHTPTVVQSTSSAPVYNETVSSVSHPVKYESYDDVEKVYGKLHHTESGQKNFLNYMNQTKPNGDSAAFLPHEDTQLPSLENGQIVTDQSNNLPDLTHGQIVTDGHVNYEPILNQSEGLPSLNQGQIMTDKVNNGLPSLDHGQIVTEGNHVTSDQNLPDLSHGQIITESNNGNLPNLEGQIKTDEVNINHTNYDQLPSLENGQIMNSVDTTGLPDLSHGQILVDSDHVQSSFSDQTPVMPDLTNGQIVDNHGYNLEDILVKKPVDDVWATDDVNEMPDLTQGQILVK